MPESQEIRCRYKGDFTNTDRWAHFTNKPGDVFVSTPPKCGTTWTTSIVTMLCHGRTDLVPTEIVQWVDAEVVPIDEAVSSLNAQTVRRCIKSHTPFDGMPYFEDAAYIAVYRHPIDMLFSLRNHTANMKNAPPDHPYCSDSDTSLRHFASETIDFENYDEGTLEAMVRHYRSFIQSPVPENIIAIHYADMLSDPRGAIQKIADFMGLEENSVLTDAVYDATKFSKMKSQAERFAPFANRDFWRSSTAFFDTGGTKKWTGKLSETSLAIYRNRIDSMLSKEELVWLENGSSR